MCRFLSIVFVLFVVFASCESQAKSIRIRSGRPLQEQLTVSNAVYIVSGRIDLNGASMTLPANSTLLFKRNGLLTKGTLQGNKTQLSGKPRFEDVHLKGEFTTQEFYTSWCSANSLSDYIEDVMNLGGESTVVVDCDITLNDQKKYVDHLNLKGKKKTITNSDRYYITYGGTNISDLKFCWDKGPVQEPKDNYRAVVIYWDLLQKDTTLTTNIINVEADGGRYYSFFMKQYKSSTEPKLTIVNTIESSKFENFTRGAIWTCGGTGRVKDCQFNKIGYDASSKLFSVYPLRLGYSNIVGEKGKAIGYEVSGCKFCEIVAAYNAENDGRELHGLLAYGDSIIVRNNQFVTLSTSFGEVTDPGSDSEILYIKGSYNTIENNTFKNGVGSSSDAVITLKTGETEGNTIKNNTLYVSSNAGKFLYIGGRNHIVVDNKFISTYAEPIEGDSYCIYLGHHTQDSGKESIVIQHNYFSFTGKSGYMAVYANSWGSMILEGNTFLNPNKLLKCNKREGNVYVKDNIVVLDEVLGKEEDIFISLSYGDGFVADINNNDFSITSTKTGLLVSGSSYRFVNNSLNLNKSSMNSLLRGNNTQITAIGNSLSIDNESTIRREGIVGELLTEKLEIRDNTFHNRKIVNTYK